MAVALAHQTAGHGPPLMLLHGLFGSSTNWRSIARQLEARFTVVSVDLRNHGRSPHAAGMSYFDLAGDVIRVIEQRGLGAVHLMGHSMGGKTAMRMALDYPDAVRTLTVADIAPAPSAGDHDPVLFALQGLDLSAVKRRSDADRTLAKTLPDPGLRSFLLQNLSSGPDGFSWRIGLREIEAAMDELLDFPSRTKETPFVAPTLFLRGEHSDYLRNEHWPVVLEYFPLARLVTIENAGHWLHAEQPQAFVENLTGFIGSAGSE